jgi:putative SOS response-associated peptidase YedK
MEWGFPHQVPGKRPGVMLDTFVTNARHLHYPLWRDTFANPSYRCLVPFTHFVEPHPSGVRATMDCQSKPGSAFQISP